jgi:ABC-type nitrate/sulfonate/bicarbonate transport system permease component
MVTPTMSSPVTPRRRLGGLRSPSSTARAWTVRLVPPVAFSVLVLVAWQLIVVVADLRETILPRPTVVASHIYDERQLLIDNAWVTLKEILVGFAIALAVGLTLAMLISASQVVERAVYPWMIASQMVPIVAIAPLLVVWFGFDMTPKVIVVALVSFFPLAVNTVDGLRAPPREMIDLMRTLGAGHLKIFRTVRVPAALPFVFSGAKIAIAFATLGAVFGEWVGASDGLGYLILTLNNQSATADVFGAIFALSLLGIGLFGLVSLLERVVLAWRFASHR